LLKYKEKSFLIVCSVMNELISAVIKCEIASNTFMLYDILKLTYLQFLLPFCLWIKSVLSCKQRADLCSLRYVVNRWVRLMPRSCEEVSNPQRTLVLSTKYETFELSLHSTSVIICFVNYLCPFFLKIFVTC